MTATWKEKSESIHERFIRLAQVKGSLQSDREIVHFLVLAICGEAGELANLFKKEWRGDEVNRDDILDEIADIRIYLEHLARHLAIDIDKACDHKLEIVSRRLDIKEEQLSIVSGK